MASTLLALTACTSAPIAKPTLAPVATLDPSELYGELFERVQLAAIFPDSKTFVDMTAKRPHGEILADYEKNRPQTKDDLAKFVTANFVMPENASPPANKTKRKAISRHISDLWNELSRKPDENVIETSSLIPLPYAYVVPGGRFREVYYWDSYFTQLGLLADKKDEVFKGMVKNFAHLVSTYGRIPNGNRDYYWGRSQPPFFSYMVSLWMSHYGKESAREFLPALKREHLFWMSGDRRVEVNGGVLNRFWDDRARPRPESYREDVELAKKAGEQLHRPSEEVYRDLRAGAESGWDYSTRWFKDPSSFASIQTTAYLPVDLNALLYHLELTIADLTDSLVEKEEFTKLAETRKALMHQLMWDVTSASFKDYNFKTKSIAEDTTIATVVPLFTGVATREQAAKVARTIERDFLKPGGLVTTLRNSGQQWDAPNGWAPHQWMGYAGLRRYGFNALASKIQSRWMKLNRKVYVSTGKLMEKYNVVDMNLKSGGGEYPNQDGFGWTNGVYRAFENPKEALKHLRFESR